MQPQAVVSLRYPVRPDLQAWVLQAFERVQFGAEPVHSEVLDAWFIADGRDLNISNDRRGTQRWLTAEEQLGTARVDAERAQANAERERQARLSLEERVRELEAKLSR